MGKPAALVPPNGASGFFFSRTRLPGRAIGWLRIVRSGFGDEAQGFGAVVSVVEEGLVE
jgi:hypothetical protein